LTAKGRSPAALQATAWLGGLAEMVGDHVKATRLHREGLRMAEEFGLWPEVSVRLAWLGWIAVQQCDYAQARDLSGQALRLAAEQGYRVGRPSPRSGWGSPPAARVTSTWPNGT